MKGAREPDQRVFTLHRYFICADRMRVHFDTLLAAGSPMAKGQFDPETFLYMSYWYAATYVVIEGWRKLGLHDPKIDPLLDSPNVELLRRYRNGAFHFQPTYFDRKFEGFIGSTDSPTWIRQLRCEFSRYFLDWFKSTERGGEHSGELKERRDR